MLVTIHDEGSINGSFGWSDPRDNESLYSIDMESLTPDERSVLVDEIVQQVTNWQRRPLHRATYTFYVESSVI